MGLAPAVVSANDSTRPERRMQGETCNSISHLESSTLHTHFHRSVPQPMAKGQIPNSDSPHLARSRRVSTGSFAEPKLLLHDITCCSSKTSRPSLAARMEKVIARGTSLGRCCSLFLHCSTSAILVWDREQLGPFRRVCVSVSAQENSSGILNQHDCLSQVEPDTPKSRTVETASCSAFCFFALQTQAEDTQAAGR